MSSHPTFVTNFDNSDDLLLSYLNADYLDTTMVTDTANSSPPSSVSSSKYDDTPFSPTYSSHPPPSPSSIPFSLAMNSLASNFTDTFGLMTGVSPCSISRGDGSSLSKSDPSTCVTPHYQPMLTSCTRSSSTSPTLSLSSATTTSSSSDLDEPKRKRERKNQNGSKRQYALSRQSPMVTTTPTTMLACKPILPAGFVTGDQQYMNSRYSSSLAPLTTPIKYEPMDTPDASDLAATIDYCRRRDESEDHKPTVDHQQPSGERKMPQQHQQQRQSPPMDTNSKRQERLIKNRAAALLSRKRKREHLQALEDERQWLTKENGVLTSKATALEAKLQQLEKEHQHQAQQFLLLQQQYQQQQQRSLLSYESGTSMDTTLPFSTILSSLDSLSTVTNVLMILLLSFVLLSLPGSSDTDLFTNGDSTRPSFTSTSSQKATTGTPSMNLALLPKQQQQHFSSSNSDTSNAPSTLDQQHQVYYRGDVHSLGNGKGSTWS